MAMNGYNFTERVRKVLAMAREDAHELHHEYVGTEHLLLGLIREGAGVADTVLTNLGVDQERMRDRLLEVVQQGKADYARPDLPYTSRAKKVLELAMQEARVLNHSYVGTEHLLLGLIAEQKGIAAQVLVDAGVTLDAARQEVLRILGTPETEDAAPRRRRPAVRTAPRAGIPLAERARRVVARAYDLAAERGDVCVTGAHVAIALLEHGEGAAVAVLDRLGADRSALLAALEPLAPPTHLAVTPETVLSLEAALVDSYAAIESELRTGAGPVAGTGHLLLGVLQTAPGVAQVFAAHGVPAERFRDELRKISG
jgi:ATP-dependent Clp protease ATP-binding subunit ClpA